MVANPEITNVIATQAAGTVRCLIAIRNNLATSGMVKTLISQYSGGACIANTYIESSNCILPSISTHISGVQSILLLGVFTPTPTPSALCVRTYQCISGENCPGAICSSFSTSPYWTKYNIPIEYGLGVTPGVVTNISVTPGDGNLIFKWDPPTNAPVAYYAVELFRGTTSLQGGFIIYNTSGGLPVSGLTNGTLYRLEVSVISDDGYQGPLVSISGTPIAPCVTPLCNIDIA